MLAVLLQAPKHKNNARSVTANAKTKRMLLAALLQTPKLKECYSQRYCKRQNLRNVTCIAYANAKTKRMLLA